MPFDMFVSQGFGHRGEDYTFETLYKQFAIRELTVKRIAQIIHDADLGDEKFGRAEALGLDKVLNGWAKNPQLNAFVRGVTAAATGAIAGAVIVLARRSVYDLPTILNRAVSLAVLFRMEGS
jgi:hypothetical protein